MEKLSDGFSQLLEDESFRLLLTIASAYETPDTQSHLMQKSELAEKLKLTPDMSLKQALRQVPNWEQTRPHMLGYLRSAMYELSPVNSMLTAENAPAYASGHPVALWLYEFWELLRRCCLICNACSPDDLPERPFCVVRVWSILVRFEQLLLPVMKLNHSASSNGFIESLSLQ